MFKGVGWGPVGSGSPKDPGPVGFHGSGPLGRRSHASGAGRRRVFVGQGGELKIHEYTLTVDGYVQMGGQSPGGTIWGGEGGSAFEVGGKEEEEEVRGTAC